MSEQHDHKSRGLLKIGVRLALENGRPFTITLAKSLLEYLWDASENFSTPQLIALVDLLRDLSDHVEQRFLK
jgi:hypothetical protein